ncbi:MAG: hypothetical protein QCI38_08175, partial [Candidatus Thermoplasmatota archaeon]|nr:hypothetical protein [Candidatus Thermoplasmatota archaeon]
MKIKKNRKEMGLDAVIHGLAGIVVRVEAGTLETSVRELVSTTSLEHVDSFVHNGFSNALLEAEKTPAFIVREGREASPFREFNTAPRTLDKPDTRLESFIFETEDMEHLLECHRALGMAFPEEVLRWRGSCYARLKPSMNTHNSIGYVQFDGERTFKPEGAGAGMPLVQKPERDHVHNVGFLDHSATRLTHLDRTPAILELMMLTGYDFTEAIYVKSFNSITNVTRLQGKDFAMVLTSGIKPYTG